MKNGPAAEDRPVEAVNCLCCQRTEAIVPSVVVHIGLGINMMLTLGSTARSRVMKSPSLSPEEGIPAMTWVIL